jgi:hypothetical protein
VCRVGNPETLYTENTVAPSYRYRGIASMI